MMERQYDEEQLRAELETYTREDLIQYAMIITSQLDIRGRVLALIPGCVVEGVGCIPHYTRWILERVRRDNEKG